MYTKSIANFIPKLCTDSQGAIHKPDPGSRLLCLNKPVRLFALVSATSAASARTVPLSRFRTFIRKFIGYNTNLDPVLRLGDFSRQYGF